MRRFLIAVLLSSVSTAALAQCGGISANTVCATDGTGLPKLRSSLPNAVQDNISRLGTITSMGAPLGSAFGGLGVNASAANGVPLFSSGVTTFTGTTGTGTFVRASGGTAILASLSGVSGSSFDTEFSLANAGAGGRSFSLLSSGNGSGNPAGSFGIKDNVAGLTRLTIDSSGLVTTRYGLTSLGDFGGIKLTSPTSGAFIAADWSSSTQQGGFAFLEAGAEIADIHVNGSAFPTASRRKWLEVVNVASTAGISWWTNGIHRAALDQNGNFGLGLGVAGTPTAQLHTNGSVRFAGLTNSSVKGCVGNDTSGNLTAGVSCSYNACETLEKYNGAADNSTNNDSAWVSAVAAVAASHANGGCIEFGPGIYRFNTAPSVTFPDQTYSLSLIGKGRDATILNFPNATNGITVTCIPGANTKPQSFRMYDMGLTTAQNGVGYGVRLTGSCFYNTFRGLSFRGADGVGLTNHWATAIEVRDRASFVVFDDVTVVGSSASSGNGVIVKGDDVGLGYGIVYKWHNSAFINVDTAIEWQSYIQGLFISNTDFTNGNRAVHVPAGQTGVLSQLAVVNSQVDVAADAIDISTCADQVMVTNTLFYVPQTSAGIVLNVNCGLQAIGNNFTYDGTPRTNQNGIIVGSSAAGVRSTITGNVFDGQLTAVWLQATSSWVTVQSNGYGNNTSNVVDAGANNTVGDSNPATNNHGVP